MTAFSVAKLGQLVFVTVVVCFLLLLRFYIWIQLLSRLIIYIYIYISSILYVSIVRVLLLEHSHQVISSSVYFDKLILDVRRSNSFILEGRKVAQAERCRHNVIVCLTVYNLLWKQVCLTSYIFIYSVVISIHLHSVGYLISQRPHAFLSSSKWQTQQTIVVTRYGKRQEEYRIEDVDRLAFLRLMTSSRSLSCCGSKTWRITSRIWACQECLHAHTACYPAISPLVKNSPKLGPVFRVPELCESRGGRPGLSVLTSLMVTVDVT